MATLPIGRLTESVTFLSSVPQAIPVTSLTSVGTIATAVTGVPHGLRTGEYVAIRGAVPLAYNSTSTQVTVTAAAGLTYAVPAGLASPATGTITVTWTSDSQGGTQYPLTTVGQAFASIEPLSAAERLFASSAVALVTYRAVVHYRTGLTPQMKLQWTRYQELTPRALEIFGIYPHPEPSYAHRFLILECGEMGK
jgi:head-tail adaptor